VHEDLSRQLFAIGAFIRYVAFGEGQRVSTTERSGLDGASDQISDQFEELFVNPAILTLARQRGELDCGGLRYVAVEYGNFTQLVIPTVSGHVSIALETGTDLRPVAEAVGTILTSNGLSQDPVDDRSR